MTDRYERIRGALAMGPTPGPWAACRTNSGTFVKSERLVGYFVEVRHCRTTQDVRADAHLIAACDPDTIRALLEERDALAAKVASYERAERENASLQAEVGQLRELSDEMFSAMTAALLLAPHSSGAYSVLDDAVKSLQPKWIRRTEGQS